MGLSVADLRAKVKRPVRSIDICLDGELWDRHDELTRALDEVQAANRGKMGQSARAREVAEQLREAEEAMRAAEVTFKFRGISSYQLATIQARFPAKTSGEGWDVQAGAHALIAACMVEPVVMTEEEAHGFLEDVHMGATDRMVSAAWLATTGSSEVPFSARASELIRPSGSK